jgi:methylmalonyl-CoA decarboxylase
MDLVETRIDGSIGTVCLHHPEKRNALSAVVDEEIARALEGFAEARARAVIDRARPGVKIWSSGHDVDELPEGRRYPLGWHDPLRMLIRAIENHPAPVIAMIEGGVFGGACEAAMACDIIIAAPNATFALTLAKLGVPYNASGMLTFLNGASLRVIKEMAFTARPVAAERALSVGLLNHLVPLEELESFTYAMATDIVETQFGFWSRALQSTRSSS